MRLLVLFVALFVAAPALAVPLDAKKYQRELTRIVQQEWGLNGSAARAAAQIHQESGWRTDVDSYVGAAGLAQFMPGTAKWIVEVYPDLGEAAPYSPTWAMRAMARYDAWLFARTKGNTHCDRWFFTLRAYNGGEGHLRAESRHAADPLDRVSVESTCGKARRSSKHCPENTGYPKRILLKIEAQYLANGWRGKQTCG